MDFTVFKAINIFYSLFLEYKRIMVVYYFYTLILFGGAIIKLNGNLESIKRTILNEIEALYDMELQSYDFLPMELAVKLGEFTGRINREIAVYINRKGKILNIILGDISTVSLPELDGRKSENRLSGIRCIHTHPNGTGILSALDISSLLSLKLDAMTALGVKEGQVVEAYTALPVADEKGEIHKAQVYGPYYLGDENVNELFHLINDIDKASRGLIYKNDEDVERAILVGIDVFSGKTLNEKSGGLGLLDELEELAITAGVTVLHKVTQKKQVKDSTYFVGKGMAEQIGFLRQELDANLIIFDDELTGAQVRNIEQLVGAKVIDRTTLILDIFAQRARSKEGKLQVELAQLKYRLPRLLGFGTQLSRLGGGIGTRGPGEKKLEVDKRHINRRVSFLESELKNLGERRGQMREGRKKESFPTIAIVGYTNVGKSTLMNKLSGSDVFAENKLFATLDPTTRSLKLPDDREVLLVDTVGFIRKLPHDLIEAFKSSLEEAVSADILLHVVDASTEEAGVQIQVVNSILEGLGAINKPIALVLNKIDVRKEESRIPISNPQGKVFEISALTGQGLEGLLEGISQMIPKENIEVNVLVPYTAGWVIPFIHENGEVISEEYTEQGIKADIIIKKMKIEKIREYIV
jgi:GTPase